MILARFRGDQARGLGIAYQAQTLTGHAQANLKFGANGHPLDEAAEGVDQELV